MTSSSAAEADAPVSTGNSQSSDICVVDIGKHTRKQIRKLRRGDGKLMTKAEQIVQDLKDQGVLAQNANTVVLVVQQKGNLRSLLD